MVVQPRLEYRGEQACVYIPVQASMRQWNDVIECIPQLFEWLEKNGVTPRGALYFRYHVLGDMERHYKLDVGIPVGERVETTGRVKSGTLPGGTYLVHLHKGHPDGLFQACQDLESWAKSNGVEFDIRSENNRNVWKGRFEHYLTNPEVEPDPDKWKTEIAILTRSWGAQSENSRSESNMSLSQSDQMQDAGNRSSSRKVIYSMMVSLDGFVDGSSDESGLGGPDSEVFEAINDHQRDTDTLLFGRRMYEIMAFWDEVDEHSDMPEEYLEFARLWREQKKIVFSSTLTSVRDNARLAERSLVDEINYLKEQPGKNIEIAGPQLAATAIKAGLVDRYGLYVQPVLLGSGKPFFPDLDHVVSLRLVEQRSFASGTVYLCYEPAEANLKSEPAAQD